jgi:hypothetical protein
VCDVVARKAFPEQLLDGDAPAHGAQICPSRISCSIILDRHSQAE